MFIYLNLEVDFGGSLSTMKVFLLLGIQHNRLKPHTVWIIERERIIYREREREEEKINFRVKLFFLIICVDYRERADYRERERRRKNQFSS